MKNNQTPLTDEDLEIIENFKRMAKEDKARILKFLRFIEDFSDSEMEKYVELSKGKDFDPRTFIDSFIASKEVAV
jgi:RAB protein geranylgeranyltransferase component A